MLKPMLLLVMLQQGSAAYAQERPDVYVLAGQSNMSGRGALVDLTDAERVVDPRIRVFGNDGRWRTASDPLDSAEGQIDAVSADKQAAVGPGMPFARAMTSLRKRPVALVPCAKGGVSIARWAPAEGRETLYGSCLARIREAGGRLAGILWYQGESDAEKPEAEARGWSASFTALVGRLRRDVAAPRLPVVFVQIADKPERDALRYPGWTTIQDQQAAVALPCTNMVSARHLGRNPDDLHLTTASQRVLGAAMARTMAELMRQGCR